MKKPTENLLKYLIEFRDYVFWHTKTIVYRIALIGLS